ncbi:MAG: ATP-dependent Clp protease adaptor ClpS [Bacteroidetes bacterium]|nr:ATP-dependent Clp protease adaptor ClpS [Bacteroidota bacterium]
MVKEKLHPLDKNQELLSDKKELILFNDDFNTFDFVIQSLIDICGHNSHQAEQCTWIVHFKGKCGVKQGSFEELNPCCNEMTNRNLTVAIK